jgi:xylose isomerase
MRTYLILKEKAERFNQDPEIQELLAEIRQWDVELQERMQYSRENAAWLKSYPFDREALGKKGYQYERLDQLTMELLMGIR